MTSHRDARPRLLLVEHQAHRRLALIDRLRDRFHPEAIPLGQDPLRTLRARRPEMVLLVVHPWMPNRAYRVCRWLKTDARPLDRVGIINLNGPARSGSSVLNRDHADGYYQGPEDLEALEAFARAIWQGRRPVVEEPRPGRSLRALLAR